jgi:hypothetical protein
VVSDYTGSTKTVTLTAGVTFTAAATDNISFFPPANARWFAALATVALPLTPTTAGRALDVSAGGEAGIDWANIGSPTTAQNLSATNIDVDQVVASVSGAVGSVTGAVGSVAAGGITAASFAANAINAAKLDPDVTTELQAGLATAAALTVIDDFLDTEIAAIKTVTDNLATAIELDGAVYRFTANALELAPSGGLDAAGIRAAIGMASANLDTQLGAIDDFLDTEVAAIKAKTDQLTFTVANTLNANIVYVNGTQVTGDGSPGSEWGPI